MAYALLRWLLAALAVAVGLLPFAAINLYRYLSWWI